MQNGPIRFVMLAFFLAALVVFGLIWFFFLGPSAPVGLGWYLFSFAAGLTMIVLPCTLPLAFVIVPLSLGKGPAKGLGIALSFGLGVAITLSMYGVLAALVGEVAIGTIGAPLETVKNWLYFAAGFFAYLFALGEIGLIKFRMPTYTGAAPAFIQRGHDYTKALLLGLFLGNIGVGCPHPATPVLLTRIAASGDVFYGWLLFFVHAAGRVLPLILLALLAVLGVNALNWLVARKEKIERATGWSMVFVGGFILVLGLFTHDWWVYSGQHTLLESITQEERFLGIVSEKIGAAAPHGHGIPSGTGLFDLPLWLGNWVLVGLWALPLWWYFAKKLKIRNKKISTGQPETEEEKIEARIMPYRFWLNITLTLFLLLAFAWVLPDRFLNHRAPMHEEENHLSRGLDRGHEAEYHEEGQIREGLAVNLNVTPMPVNVGVAATLDFFVNQKPGNVPVEPSALEIDHTKLVHVIGVRRDLNEFFHVHPEISETPGIFSIAHGFVNPGSYKIWSEIKKDGVNYAFGHPEIQVGGEGAPEKKEVSFGRNVIAGDYQVALKLDEPVIQKKEAHLSFDIHTLTGREVEVEDFIGAPMHLAVIKDDWAQFIHAHPEEDMHGVEHGLRLVPEARAHVDEEVPGATMRGGEDETIEFHLVFPEPGLYKAFAQFRPHGVDLPADEALLATFWIRVEDKAPLFISNWWLYLLISLVLMAILSAGVQKYLKVSHE